ncbi:FUSC family protein [Cellulosimicrobium terreum]|nr:FUSC family protein [Cellulosimicrobium terreum]
MTGAPPDGGPRRPAVSWSWLALLLGTAYAVVPVLATVADPARGLALAVGVLPAVALGLRATRRERVLGVLVGAVAGVSLFLGSLVASTPVLAVATVLVLSVLVASATATATSRPGRRLAPLALGLGLPLFGAGLSVDGATAGAGAAVLLLAGSVYAALVSLAWPVRATAPRTSAPPPPRAAMVAYGVQIGVAGALAAAIGFALGIDHPGWACTAALLVSRPRWDALRARGTQRSVAVLAGALLACAVVALGAPDPVLAALLLAVLACGTATAGSRWYVLPFFTTTVVLSLLLVGDDAGAEHWFVERVGATLLGVALALGAAWTARRLRSVV